MQKTLFSYLDSQADTVVHWQREMTSRPALGPENNGVGELEKAIWIHQELSKVGLCCIQRHDCPDERVPCGYRPNISARVPGKSSSTLWIIGHMDIVPPGEDRLWETSPYDLRVEGDYIYGRGVEDNQQAIVTGMLAADALIQNNSIPDLSLGLMFVSDEETGMRYGLPHILSTCPELIKPDDLILVSDMGNHGGSMIEVAEKSLLWFRIAVKGKQCHASTPDKGINSLIAASACVLEFERLYRKFRNKNTLFSPPWSTFVPSKKEANVENINTLPGMDVFYLDCRILPEYNIADIENEVRIIADEIACRYKTEVTVELVHKEQAPDPTPDTAPVVQLLSKRLKEVRGTTPLICGVGGQTVAAPLRHKHFNVAVWGTLIPNAHVPNECSRISATIADAKVLIAMLFEDSKAEGASAETE